MRGDMRDQEVNKSGVHDVKSPINSIKKLQKKTTKVFLNGGLGRRGGSLGKSV